MNKIAIVLTIQPECAKAAGNAKAPVPTIKLNRNIIPTMGDVLLICCVTCCSESIVLRFALSYLKS